MINKELVDTTVWRTISWQCDRCKKEFTDTMEIQEFFSFESFGGYNSIVGDGAHIAIDLCQRCAQNLLSAYWRVNGEEE